LAFAREGGRIAVSGRRPEKLSETVSAIEAIGARGLAVPCDVTEEASLISAVKFIVDRWGAIDIAVANAGYSVMGWLEDLDLAYWQRQFDVNVFGLIRTIRTVLPELHKTQGRLVLIGSVAAFVTPPKGVVYAASKACVRVVGEALSTELKGSGVSCTTVHPAYVESDIIRVDNDGRLHENRRDPRPKWLIWKADEAAKVIVDAAYRRRREVVLSAYGKLAVGLSRFAPGLLQTVLRQSAGHKKREQLGRPPQCLEMTGEPKHLLLGRSPGTVEIYLRSFRWIPVRSQGGLPQKGSQKLSPIEVLQPAVRIDSHRLGRFRNVCGNPDNGLLVPPAYPECLFLGPMAEAVLSDAFPFSPFGLIHIRQKIVLLHLIHPDVALDLSCSLAEIRQTDRGFEIDFSMRADVAGKEAWKGMATLLSRNKKARSGHGRRRVPSTPSISEDEPFRSILIHVPEDTGRRYAAASGDWNPHHLFPVTARLLGYRRAIAHGMWTFARTLAAIEAEQNFELPMEAEASFKRPIFLPGEIEIRLFNESFAKGKVRSVRFDVRDACTHELHMTGMVRG